MFAALCHGLDEHDPKTMLTRTDVTERFLRRVTEEKELIAGVTRLIRYQRIPLHYYQNGAGAYEIRRLALEVPLQPLILLAGACYKARTAEALFLAGAWLNQKAAQFRADPAALHPLLQGRDLIEAGLHPSPAFKQILEQAFDAQLKGNLSSREEAMEWLRNYRSDLG